MESWRDSAGNRGFDLGDGMECLLDLRFADDILLLAAIEEELTTLLDALVEELAGVGLLLNPAKTVVLTNQAQFHAERFIL